MPGSTSARAAAERLARDFLERVWGPAHDIGAIDDLMTCDYVIHSGGRTIRGRDALKAWVVEFHRLMPEAVDEIKVMGGRLAECWVEREAPKVLDRAAG